MPAVGVRRTVAGAIGTAHPASRTSPNPGHNEPTYKDYWEIPGGAVEADESAQIRLPAEELHGWAWCTEQEAGRRLSELVARRIAAAMRARAESTAVYLENGSFVA